MVAELKGITISILTCNRTAEILRLVKSLSNLTYKPLEIIIVDNGSIEDFSKEIYSICNKIKVLRLEENIGIAARNVGIRNASHNIVITLDDDVLGLKDEHFYVVVRIFNNKKKIAGINFKVLDPNTGNIINWAHPYKSEVYGDKCFITNDFMEGAIAFRKDILMKTTLYPEYFFLSHEGPDLTLQIMKKGYYIMYSPKIVVYHYHSSHNRTNWRRYYFDTRNLFWFVIRNYPCLMGIKFIVFKASALLFYSIRDGYLRYWIKAVCDAIKDIRRPLNDRDPINKDVIRNIHKITRHKPDIVYMLKKRIIRKGIRI